MANFLITIVDENGNSTQREMTKEEATDFLNSANEYKVEQDALDSKELARISALNKLADLGLSEEEIKALL